MLGVSGPIGVMLLAPFCMPSAELPALKEAIRRLGSPSCHQRQAAMNWLFDRPEAAPLLRLALKSTDREVSTRAAAILEHFERRPVARIDAAVRAGDISEAIDLLVKLPKKYDSDAWREVCELARIIVQRNQDKVKHLSAPDPWEYSPNFMVADSAEQTELAVDKLRGGNLLFVRGAHVVWPNNNISWRVIVASGSVRTYDDVCAGFIFARGSVDMHNTLLRQVVVSDGDVVIHSTISDSLVIARGSVTLLRGGTSRCRIISGKSVTYKWGTHNIITENEPNPLGYIRWSDAPKDKRDSKKK